MVGRWYVSRVVVVQGFAGLVGSYEGVDGLAHVAHGAGAAADVSCCQEREREGDKESWRTI